ncbi:MAG: peptide chain release factor N(5)-glutamine methyltransferase [Solirubrobacterales bacterium]
MAAGGVSRSDALEAATEAFQAAGIPDPRTDAEVLLAGITSLPRAELVVRSDESLEPSESRQFSEAVRRRLKREPVAYILGRQGFRHLELAVDPRVLIPRPETEGLVEVALEASPSTVLEVGTGSGAVALAIAEELPGCEVVATDISPDALAVARTNAAELGLAGRVRFEVGTWPKDGGRFDLVLANLPYVDREREAASLQPEVITWEPDQALFGGKNGIEVIASTLEAMAPSGVVAELIALEVGAGQAPEVSGLLREAGFGELEVRPDLAGIDRVVVGRKSTGRG